MGGGCVCVRATITHTYAVCVMGERGTRPRGWLWVRGASRGCRPRGLEGRRGHGEGGGGAGAGKRRGPGECIQVRPGGRRAGVRACMAPEARAVWGRPGGGGPPGVVWGARPPPRRTVEVARRRVCRVARLHELPRPRARRVPHSYGHCVDFAVDGLGGRARGRGRAAGVGRVGRGAGGGPAPRRRGSKGPRRGAAARGAAAAGSRRHGDGKLRQGSQGAGGGAHTFHRSCAASTSSRGVTWRHTGGGGGLHTPRRGAARRARFAAPHLAPTQLMRARRAASARMAGDTSAVIYHLPSPQQVHRLYGRQLPELFPHEVQRGPWMALRVRERLPRRARARSVAGAAERRVIQLYGKPYSFCP